MDSADDPLVRMIRKRSIVPGQAPAGQDGPGPNPDVTSPSGASAGVCPDGSCSCGDCGPTCTGACCDECEMGTKTSSQRVNEQAIEAQRGWKGADSGVLVPGITRKSSPLIDRSQNPVVGRMPAPPALPVPTRGATSVGDALDTTPTSSVDSLDVPHVHRHEGTSENVRAYFHAHPHIHAIPHDPDDPNDVVDHDRADHLRDPRHVAAIRGFGGWESKSAGASPADAIRAIQADSEKVQKQITDRSVPLSMINARLADNAAALRQLSMSAELAELRKGARPTHTKRAAARVVTKRANPEFTKRQKAIDSLITLVKEREALRPYLDHSDYSIRAGAKELMAQKLAEMEKFGRGDVQKARVVNYGIKSEQIVRVVREAVQKAMANLDLNR